MNCKEGKENNKYLCDRDFSANKGRRRVADGRRRDLTTSSLLTRLLRNRRQESVTATGCHLTHQSERYQQKSRHRDRFEEMNENFVFVSILAQHPTKYEMRFLTTMPCIEDFWDFSSSISCCPSISLTVSSMVACLAFTASILHFEFSDAICSWYPFIFSASSFTNA